MLGRFGDHILGALTLAARQQRIVVKGCGPSQRNRMIPWIYSFGEGSDEEDQIDEIDDFVGKGLRILRVVYNRRSKPNRSKLWRGKWFGSLETTAQRVRPYLSRCQRVEDLGTALEDWLSKKHQYEMFTDRNGRPCQASDDGLLAAKFRLMPKPGADCYVRKRGRGLPGVVPQTAGLEQHETDNHNE